MGLFEEMDLGVQRRDDPSPSLPPAAPCLVCDSPLAWLSVYGQTSCWRCDPPPATGLIKIRLAAAYMAGQFVWRAHPSDRWEPGGGRDVGPALAALGVGGDVGGVGGEADGGRAAGVEFVPPGFLAAWFDRLREWAVN